MLLNLLLTLNINELGVHYREGAFNLLYAAAAGETRLQVAITIGVHTEQLSTADLPLPVPLSTSFYLDIQLCVDLH